MAFVFHNENPKKLRTGDCVIRAIAKVLDAEWHDIYNDIAIQGAEMCDMPDSNEVWSTYLRENGFKVSVVPDTCPTCYTVKDFCRDNPKGRYLLASGNHLVAAIDGNYYDTYDSGSVIVILVYELVEDEDNDLSK